MKRLVLCAAAMLALCGCTTAHDGAVKTADDAIAIAKQTCGTLADHLSGKWHARWEHIRWFLWHGPGYSLQVIIDDQSGKVMNPGCEVNKGDGVKIGD
jgi:hypothetical protein